MRKIALDIETTGLNPLEGHKIIEIGCVELINNFPTGNNWQTYINPERTMPHEAYEIHGLTEEFLSDKPLFMDTVDTIISIGNRPFLIYPQFGYARNITFSDTILYLRPLYNSYCYTAVSYLH